MIIVSIIAMSIVSIINGNINVCIVIMIIIIIIIIIIRSSSSSSSSSSSGSSIIGIVIVIGRLHVVPQRLVQPVDVNGVLGGPGSRAQ